MFQVHGSSHTPIAPFIGRSTLLAQSVLSLHSFAKLTNSLIKPISQPKSEILRLKVIISIICKYQNRQ